MPDPIERALAFARAGDFAAALAPMLEVWRETPDPKLADAITAIGAAAGRNKYAPIARTAAQRDRAWLDLANADDPAIRGSLLATVDEGDLVARFTALLAFPDPRTAARLVEVLLAPDPAPYLRWAVKWRPLMAALATCGDPRVLDCVAEISTAWNDRVGNFGAAARDCRARVAKLLAKARAAYPKSPPKLPPAAREIVATIVATAPHTDDREMDAELRAAIYAAPVDDGPRAIYADWLQERGDPRGEFIALQLARRGRAAGRRERDLEHLHGRAWLGSLASHVNEHMYITYERGFPSYLPLYTDAPPPDPAWATLESVNGGFPASNACPMPVLHTATEVSADALLHLVAMTTPPPLEVLEVAYADSKPRAQVLAALAKLRLPKLRRLALRTSEWVTEPAYAPRDLGALCAIGPLEELELSAPLEQLAAWIIAAEASTLKSFTLVVDRWTVRCERDKAKRLSRITAGGSKPYDEGRRIQLVAAALDQLPANTITALEMDLSKKVWTAALRQDVARALDRHRKLKATLPGFKR